MKTAIKTKRGVSVMYSHEFADGRHLVRVVYHDGKGKRDGYYVSRELDSLTVKWDHVSDLDRSYVVTCTTSGQAVACECRGSTYGDKCRHQLGTVALLNVGELDNGPTQQDGYPDGWGWDAERADAEDAYHAAMLIGPRVDSFRVS